MYDEPVLEWGCSPSVVISKQKQGSLRGAYSNHALAYDKVGSSTGMVYLFDDNDKLASVGVVFELSYVSRVTSQLMERYLMIPYVSGDIIAAGVNSYDEDKATVAVSLMYYNTSYFMIMYIPGPGAK